MSQNGTLEGLGGAFLWYHPGTIPVPYPHHANTVPVLGVQDTRKPAGTAGFLTK